MSLDRAAASGAFLGFQSPNFLTDGPNAPQNIPAGTDADVADFEVTIDVLEDEAAFFNGVASLNPLITATGTLLAQWVAIFTPTGGAPGAPIVLDLTTSGNLNAADATPGLVLMAQAELPAQGAAGQWAVNVNLTAGVADTDLAAGESTLSVQSGRIQ